MMAIKIGGPPLVLGRDLGTQLSAILGLDSNKVRRITVDAPCDDFALVTVEMYTYDQEAKDIAELVKRYNLSEAEEEG